MIKTTHSLFLLFLFSLGSLLSCSKEDDVLDREFTDLGGETWEKGPLDFWLDTTYVDPYNIEVKYRFDRYELALNRMVVPVQEDRVIPVMEAIKKTWITPYEEEAGETFIRKYSPKQFVLVGSPQYNPNGTITLGTAEGGRRVILYKLNDFDKKNAEEVKQMLHTIHHEFAHILHQTVMYPDEFEKVSTGYTASWNDYSLADARSRGFITEYARSSPDEDFVEMVSLMLTEGKRGFDAIVESVPEAVRPDLREKEQIVVRYFKETWNIDLYALQSRTEKAIRAL